MTKSRGDERLDRIAKAARAFYLQHLSQDDIASDMGVAPATVRAWLKLARDVGVVEFNVDPSYARVGRLNEVLQERMKLVFGLDHALVVDPRDRHEAGDAADDEGPPPAVAAGGEDHAVCDLLAGDDLLHIYLANQAGNMISNEIQAGDEIAVAGGRGVYRAVQRVKRRPPPEHKNIRNLRISPLCGRVWAHSWNLTGPGHIERPLDADDCAFVLAQAFETLEGISYTQIGMPLYADDATEAQRIMKEHCAFLPGGQWNWGRRAANRAIVGCGVLDPKGGHRMADVYGRRKTIPETAPYLSRAGDELAKIISLAEEGGLPYPGDVANRLFCALPLPKDLADTGSDCLALLNKSYEGLNAAIQALNDRSVLMGWEHLRGMPFVWAVAGGELKTRALWTLLLAGCFSNNGGLITAISTDVRTAETLLEARAQLRKNYRLQEWYRHAVLQCFS